MSGQPAPQRVQVLCEEKDFVTAEVILSEAKDLGGGAASTFPAPRSFAALRMTS